jgi:AraC family transcriptional regulator, regulatory protein of adaptative response / DNA-3-methyladenine glycosylase II
MSLKVKSETRETAGVAGAILGLVLDDFDACWQAIESRDPRFDGRLFVGIVTTGVYCRPICPAPMAKRENVRFHASAAACEAAGFRPCRRCRPETAPGSPEWLGGSATVARALRLISEGFLDANPVGELARRLRVGERQLRRLFAAHLGAAPLAVARTRRVQLARMLIDQTDLSMADVAMTSGFGSIRRFNETIRSAFGRSPTELRGSAPPVEGLVLRLPFRPPLAWEPIVRFLAARAIPGVEEVRDSTYRRTARNGAEPGIVELERVPGQAHLRLRLRLAGIGGLAAAVEQARRVFDLGADPLQIEATLRADGRLAPLLKRHPGLRVPGAWDPFELAVRAVLGQQVSVQAATTLAGRLVRAYGEQLPQRDGALTHVFPAPTALAAAHVETIGLPRARAETIRRLGTEVADGDLVLDATADPAVVSSRLRELPGIGPWTAEYIAMRCLQDPDAFPAADLGLRRALASNGRPATAAEVVAIAAAWRPWRAYAALHLWSA